MHYRMCTTSRGTVIGALGVAARPAWAAAGFAALAVLAVSGLVRWERRTASPLIDLPTLAARGMARGLAGALCAYTVLFGPLVLFPQLRSAHGASPLQTGLILTALPGGFGLAAVAAERVRPARWPNRARCAAGGIMASGSAAALAIPAPAAVAALLLGLLGAGLGVYIPANNASIMAAAPPHRAAAAGGMVNMARGLGTALGVAAVSLALHAGASASPAMLTLAAFALAAAWAGRAAGARGHPDRAPADEGGSR